jgi:hypothetical protein
MIDYLKIIKVKLKGCAIFQEYQVIFAKETNRKTWTIRTQRRRRKKRTK